MNAIRTIEKIAGMMRELEKFDESAKPYTTERVRDVIANYFTD